MCIFFKIFHLFQTVALILLLVYTMVAIFTIKLRYKYVATDGGALPRLPAAIFRRISSDEANLRLLTSRVVWMTTLFYLIWCVLFSLIVFYYYDAIVERNTMGIFLILLAIVFLIISFVLMQMHPQTIERPAFQLRVSPLWPCLSILLNVLLLAFFGWAVWIAVGLWMVMGLVIYFGYGVKHSKFAMKD
jgi:O-antigen/teichoic acid export membrane protein